MGMEQQRNQRTPTPSPLTARPSLPSQQQQQPAKLERRGSSKRGLSHAVDYWTQESVWQHLERAGPNLQLVSGKWLAQQLQKLQSEGETDWVRGTPLPRKAYVSLDDLQSFHKSSRATPRAVVGEPKRLPIIAVSRNLAADDDEEDESGHELLRLVGGALQQRLEGYRFPYGEADPRHGPPDVGVFLDMMSLTGEAAANPLDGAVGDAIAVLFAHRLVTTYLCGAEDVEYYARSAFYRHLSQLCKRAHDEAGPWPTLVDLSEPGGADPSAPDSTASAADRRPPPSLQPPDAFDEGGALSDDLVFESDAEQERISRHYRRVCADVFFHARKLDFGLAESQPASASWDDAAMAALGSFLPLCRQVVSLRLSGNGAITSLPDSMGDMKPPPSLPFVRGKPKASAASRVSPLESLECANCSSLRALPDGLCSLTNLHSLNLEWCVTLHALPEAIGQLRELRTLLMKGCEVIHSLPESLAELRPPWGTLEVLELDFCASLVALPANAGQLSALQRLSLYGCRQLSRLPQGLRGLLSLHHLSFDGCTQIISKLPTAELEMLEERGCIVQRPVPPPPPSAREQPTYKLGAMRTFTRKMYGLDIEPDNVDMGEQAGADDVRTSDERSAGKGYVAGHITGQPLLLGEGDRYEGKYRDGKQEGRGTYYFADGRFYEGQWVAGRMEGVGTFHYGKSNEYEGEFVDGRAHGHGERLYADGDRYVGQWVGGGKEGVGTYRYRNGDEWKGEWKADKRQGAGTYHYHDGAGDFEGVWHADTHKPDALRYGPQSERTEKRQLYQALVQENEEARSVLRDLRGGVPLPFRRPKGSSLPDKLLREENAALKEFIHGVAHKEFVSEIYKARAKSKAMLKEVDSVFGERDWAAVGAEEDLALRVHE